MTDHCFDETLDTAPRIRLFLGVTSLEEEGRNVRFAIYRPSRIDRIYMEFAAQLTPCGKTRLKPDLEFTPEGGQPCKGLVLVPEDKADAILNGCSMQNNRLSPERAAQQKVEYQKGHDALRAG